MTYFTFFIELIDRLFSEGTLQLPRKIGQKLQAGRSIAP
jgi:hypothetical protein